MSDRKAYSEWTFGAGSESLQQSCIDTDSGLNLFNSGRGISLVFGVIALANLLQAPSIWTFRANLVVGSTKLIDRTACRRNATKQ